MEYNIRINQTSMPDQPASQNPNAGRIGAMLQDLAAQRTGQPAALTTPPPTNLPTTRPPQPSQPATPPPVVPAPRPVVPPPVAPGAVAPSRPTPPPAPREIPVVPAPKPAIPPPPAPTPAPKAVPTTPTVPQPSPTPVTSELRTMLGDISQVQVGRPPTGIRVPPPVEAKVPSAPTPPPTPKPATPAVPLVAIPPPTGRKGRKILLFGLVMLILVITAGIVTSFLGGNGGQIARPTPTPAPTATLAPRTKTLTSYFGNPDATITAQEGTARTDFKNALLTAQPPARQAMVMEVRKAGSPLSPAALLEAIASPVPTGFSSALGTELAVLAYGQTESYDATGQTVADAPVQTRLALVFEVADASAANQAMLTWEGDGLATASQDLFGYRLESRIVDGFASGTYRQIAMRYWNFPYADHALDWAIVLASNGKNYLVVTGSRESAFFAIDQLMQ